MAASQTLTQEELFNILLEEEKTKAKIDNSSDIWLNNSFEADFRSHNPENLIKYFPLLFTTTGSIFES